MKNYLKKCFEHILGVEQIEPFVQDTRLSLFLVGAVLSKRPNSVLELGFGLGYLAISLFYALKCNQHGQITCVDDWDLWGGREPEGIEHVRAAGVQILAPMSKEEFLSSCSSNTYDVIVSDSRALAGGALLNEHLRIATDNALLFFHAGHQRQTATDLRQIRDRVRELGLFHLHFDRASGCAEKDGAEWLLVVNQKSQVGDRRQAGEESRQLQSPGSTVVESGPNAGISNDMLYLGLISGRNYGWGICSEYLIRELSKLVQCHVVNEQDGSARNPQLDGKLFQALTSVDFFAMFEHARAERNFGYTFFENELTDHSVKNAEKYDLILAGSTWCRDRMLEKGITNCDVLIQGIDAKVFYPIEEEKDPGNFVIFSGGKFELRKGQDLVLKAVKILQEKYSDIVLATCWYNIWPESMKLMAYSPHIQFEYFETSWPEFMAHICRINGIDFRRVKTYGLVPNAEQREIYRTTDIGVFPNRCEGGTNLVLMEYMACGKPAIVSHTSGHRDIVNPDNALLLRDLRDINLVDANNRLVGRWQEPAIDELVATIEYAYYHRDDIKKFGQRAGEDLRDFTWEQTAKQLIRLME
jgi:glycosyltransferase involved in cell wall biosynthesis